MKNISNNNQINLNESAILLIGMRWVTGWLFFSAFWRRLALENKLDPEALGYVGEKFNHFFPNAIIVKPMIHYMITHPDYLHIFMIVFTIIEALVGLGLLLGLFTRASALGVVMLSMGILFGAGWIGTTCLDEWQIGVLGIISGLVMMVAGADKFSVDKFILQKCPKQSCNKWFSYISSGNLPISHKTFTRISLSIAAFSLFLTLYTNQVFHGGVWGTLQNLSKNPNFVISDAGYNGKKGLQFDLFRDQGIDTYGAFITRVTLKDHEHNMVKEIIYNDFSTLPSESIQNYYIAKVKTGKNSLVVPLGAKARITLPVGGLKEGQYTIELEDISGKIWKNHFRI